MHEIAVLSWPPPWVPVEMNMPAYLPQKEPWDHCLPLLSQKAVAACQLALYVMRVGGICTLVLRGEVSVARGDAEEHAVKLLELLGVVEDGDGGVLGRGMHLSEDLVGEGLSDSDDGY
jgi:hypothetical protein